jgi:hypothetical protein
MDMLTHDLCKLKGRVARDLCDTQVEKGKRLHNRKHCWMIRPLLTRGLLLWKSGCTSSGLPGSSKQMATFAFMPSHSTSMDLKSLRLKVTSLASLELWRYSRNTSFVSTDSWVCRE